MTRALATWKVRVYQSAYRLLNAVKLGLKAHLQWYATARQEEARGIRRARWWSYQGLGPRDLIGWLASLHLSFVLMMLGFRTYCPCPRIALVCAKPISAGVPRDWTKIDVRGAGCVLTCHIRARTSVSNLGTKLSHD
jgi:hypothetical protein